MTTEAVDVEPAAIGGRLVPVDDPALLTLRIRSQVAERSLG
ncbi:MAG: hypothetical protein WBG36_16970 [Ornithinimicrobium sp.]